MKLFSLFRSLMPVLILFMLSACGSEEADRPNVLFICVDDLRTELGCYGKDVVQSPNLDRLAGEGYLFRNHFVAVPTCGASRHALLTGRLPVTEAHTRNYITSNTLAKQDESAIPETFIHHLRRNGYYTVGIGKITHHPDGFVYGYTDPPTDIPELPYSWDEMLLDDEKWGSGHNAFFGYADGSNRNTLDGEVFPYEKAEGDDEIYVDGLTANLAIRKLQELKERDQPFFLGVGFFKPHLPFNAPARYWDLYERDQIPLAPFAGIPENSSRASLHGSNELNRYRLGEEKASLDAAVSDEYARKLRHGYYACVSYIDTQIGKLLQELDELGLEENTVVVVWGDHGWHLGDHLIWGKHTIFERANHSTLMIRIPGSEGGKKIDEIVSTVDLYPTLMELCGTPVSHSLDGESLTGLMSDAGDPDWRNTAYSYYRKGISLRTERYRLNRYFREETPEFELYDHQNDPFETVNVAEENEDLVQELLPLLEKGNTGLYQE